MEEFICRLIQTTPPERLRIISSFAILIPLAFGLASYRTGGRHLRLFFFFLLLGFFTDLLGFYDFIWSIDKTQKVFVKFFYDRIYPILEVLFFFWFIGSVSSKKEVKTISKYALWLSLVIWIVLVTLHYSVLFLDMDDMRPFFDYSYEVSVSFLASWVLLEMVEKYSSPELLPEFWLLMAIFFYTFSTLFTAIIGTTDLGKQFWFLHNVANILTYLVYATGFAIHIRFRKALQ